MKEKLISTNPAKEYAEVGSVAASTTEEIASATVAAREAFPVWRDLSVQERCTYFAAFKKAYEPRIQELAKLQSQEMGKPITESIAECEELLEWFDWQLEHAPDFLASTVLQQDDSVLLELHREPFGVVAVIVPWNYPTSQLLFGIVQPLIAGNTVVYKHSEECPLTSGIISEIFAEANFPEGVATCIYGGRSSGEALVQQGIDLIHFTGSTRAGQDIYKNAADKTIPVVLEMGGSSPGIVFEDCDPTTICESIYFERYGNAGQVCSALKRLVIHERLAEDVVEELSRIAQKQTIGDPLDERTTMGPLVAKRQLELLEEQVEDARERGATVIVPQNLPSGLDGAFYPPTIITGVTRDMRVFHEETFGPVLTVTTFTDEEEAIQIANDSEYGLSAFVYSTDMERAARIAGKLEAGQVSINGANYFSSYAPFGGYKKSGIGRSGGEIGYHNVTQEKVIATPK